MKTATGNHFNVSPVPFMNKWALIFVLLSIVLSGILIPVVFSDRTYGPVGTSGIMSAKLSVAMAAEDPVERDGLWYYGGNAYDSREEAMRAQDDPVTAEVGGTSFYSALPPERRTELLNAAPAGAKALECKGFLENAFNPICWMRMISVLIGSLLISVSALFLALADMLFNWAVDNTILLFSNSIFDNVKDGVNAGWTALRDIANIVIIGMFTFIAVSTILGIAEYGAKKLLARVLIIAVLINFSLLFTKIIIDVSNFTASQFYASSAGTTISGAQEAATARSTGTGVGTAITMDSSGLKDSFRSTGIGGVFIRFLGVTSLFNTAGALSKVADNQNGGWYIALAHGLLAFALLGAAGCVLFYGAYLLISRAVLFIFLMVTASGAFATHLIPKLNESKYGWDGWWSSLLHNAALAPILMILLWITIKVSSTLTKQQGGLLGNLVTDKVSSTDIGALFSYFIILGLLWGSFLLASKWASKVGGLSFTGMLLSSATVGTAALASRFIAAPIARKVIGGRAAKRSLVLEDDLKEASLEATEIRRVKGTGHPDYRAALDKVTGLMKQKDRADWRAKQSWNVANLAQPAMKALGVPSFLSGAAKSGGYAETAKERAEKAIKAAEKVVLKKEDIKEGTRNDIRTRLWSDERITRNFRRLQRAARDMSNAARMSAEHRDQQVPGLTQALARAQAQKTVHEQNLTNVSGQQNAQTALVAGLKGDKARADAEAQNATTKVAEILTTSRAKVAGLDQLINSNAAGSAEHTRATNEKAAEIASQTILVQAETNKINAAQAASATAAAALPAEEATLRTLNASVQTATTDVANAASNVTQLGDTIKKFNEAAEHAKADSKAADENLAKEWDTVDGDIERAVDEEVQAIVNRSKDLAVGAAAQHAHRRFANFGRFVGLNVEEAGEWNSDAITQLTRKMAGSSAGIKYKDFRDAMSAVQSQLGTSGAPTVTTTTTQQGGAGTASATGHVP